MKGSTMLLSACMALSLSSPTYADQVKDADICRFGIATVFGRSPEIMKTKHIGGGTYKVSYVRNSDASHWHNKCRVVDNRIVWGSFDGRWRMHPSDPKVTFEVRGDRIIVNETFRDGSATVKRYLKPVVD